MFLPLSSSFYLLLPLLYSGQTNYMWYCSWPLSEPQDTAQAASNCLAAHQQMQTRLTSYAATRPTSQPISKKQLPCSCNPDRTFLNILKHFPLSNKNWLLLAIAVVTLLSNICGLNILELFILKMYGCPNVLLIPHAFHAQRSKIFGVDLSWQEFFKQIGS